MPITLGFFGFVRDLNFDIRKYLDIINDTVHIYICAPDQLGEFDKTPITEDTLRPLFDDSRILSIHISLFNYNPTKFIQAAESRRLPYLNPTMMYHPHRIISLINSISVLATEMANSNTDIYILTRIDLISYTSAIGNIVVDSDTVRGWRTCPFVQEGCIEDRIIVCGRRPLESLIHYYENFPCLDESHFNSEYILGAYLTGCGHKIIPQEGTAIGIPPRSLEKYTHGFREAVDKAVKTES